LFDWLPSSSGHFATVFAKEVTPNILRSVGEIPLRLPTVTTQPIKVHEVNDSFHADVIERHSKRMQECPVYLVQGLPSWANIQVMMVIPLTNPEIRAPGNISISNYVRRLQPNGTIGDEMDQIFAEVLGGNKKTDFIIIPHQFSDDTNRLIQLIKSTIDSPRKPP
jgi:hypothetical protein